MRAGGERTVAVLDLGGAKNRLPHFEMAELGGFRLIDWVIERVRQASTIDELLVAIPDGEDDGLLTHLAVEHAVSVVRGPRDDALHHIVTAARRSRADVIVCVSVANPLVDPVEIDRVVRFFRASRPDCACEDASDYCASGLAGPVVSRAALEYLEMCVTDPQSRECATLVSLASAENLRVEAARPPSVLASSDVKLDIVTEADLGRLRGLLSLVQQEERHAGDPRSLPATAFVAAWREQQRRGHH
ncbi:MAG: hypothetical protein Q8K99_14815 [Actinomycetota bacterium]|nr:hypothetical protein [Actinomycetota bacterium]